MKVKQTKIKKATYVIKQIKRLIIILPESNFKLLPRERRKIKVSVSELRVTYTLKTPCLGYLSPEYCNRWLPRHRNQQTSPRNSAKSHKKSHNRAARSRPSNPIAKHSRESRLKSAPIKFPFVLSVAATLYKYTSCPTPWLRPHGRG